MSKKRTADDAGFAPEPFNGIPDGEYELALTPAMETAFWTQVSCETRKKFAQIYADDDGTTTTTTLTIAGGDDAPQPAP